MALFKVLPLALLTVSLHMADITQSKAQEPKAHDSVTVKEPAPASSAQVEILHAFMEGRYGEVTQLADATPTAENLALAARALNTIAYLAIEDKPARSASKEAYGYATRATEKDPHLVEAHVQAAISDAIRGGRVSPFRALLKGLAKRSRESIDIALDLAPNDPWALSTSGAWHLEVVRAGGGRVYGAKMDTGYAHLMRAREISPNNIVIGYETSLRLLAAEKEDWRAPALQALNTALESPDLNTAYEREVRRRAVLFHAAIQEGLKAERAYIKAQD